MSFFHARHFPLFQNFSLKDANKKGWVLLAGDSHVAGLSDLLEENLTNGNDHIFPSEILAFEMNKPVLGIGSPGAGPLEGFYLKPKMILDYLKSTYFMGLKDPEMIVLVFFEGNDFDNELKEVVIPFLKNHPIEELENLSTFNNFVLKMTTIETAYGHSPISSLNPRRTLIGDFIFGAFKDLIGVKTLNRYAWEDGKTWNSPNLKNTLPSNIQGPAPELSEFQIKNVIKSLKFSLVSMKKLYPRTKFMLTYLPSTFSTYDINPHLMVSVRSYHGGNSIYDSSDLEKRHLHLKKQVANLVEECGFHFHDSTKSLRELSKNKLIHGPKDWNHLNSAGLQKLIESIKQELVKIQ